MSTEQLFLLRRQDFDKEERLQKRSFDIISNLRLVVFVVGALAVLMAGYLGTARQALYVGLPFLLVFIYIIHRHDQVEARLNIARAMVKINQQYQDRLSEQWVKFTDQGQEFADPDHPYSTDLDIFGPKSLFQWISVARTYCGRQHLYQLLAEPPQEPDSILARQGAIKELAGKLEFCQGLECRGWLAPEANRDPEELIAYAEESSSVSQFMKIIRFLPLITALSLVLYFLQLLTLLVPIALLLLQSFIVLFTYQKTGGALKPVYSFQKSLHSFGGMLEAIETEPFQDPYISSLQAELKKQSIPASTAMKELGKISGAIDMNRSMFYLIINVGLLWEIQCALRLANWKVRYGDRVGDWLRVIGTMEALASLAVITHIHPDWAYPEIEGQGQKISAGELGHPLLPPDKCVRNDIDIDNYSCIVTGSNMSGKSTWLRAIGINLVLAYA
ncbi:MAG: DNA mismatch repair protein MutS, partial [Syntrophomonadaceae bacterium]|nr:DNA mismatch repair protein MutS [Syntrophomonadaceae bacterium]